MQRKGSDPIASFRSVALVVLSFRAITLLEEQEPAGELP